MTDIRSLEQTLLDNLLQNKARIKFVARFLLALVSLRQNGVGTDFVMADAILPKGHAQRRDTLSLPCRTVWRIGARLRSQRWGSSGHCPTPKERNALHSTNIIFGAAIATHLRSERGLTTESRPWQLGIEWSTCCLSF